MSSETQPVSGWPRESGEGREAEAAWGDGRDGRTEAAAPRTRAEWARSITEAWGRAVCAAIEVGDALIAAKAALKHGEWLPMVRRDLPFGEMTARKLMAIARDPRIRAAAARGTLPAGWTVLFQLQKLDDETFEAGVADGRISATTTRAEVERLGSGTPRPRDPRQELYTSAGNALANCTKQQLEAELARRQALDRLYRALVARMPEAGTVGDYVDVEEFKGMVTQAWERKS